MSVTMKAALAEKLRVPDFVYTHASDVPSLVQKWMFGEIEYARRAGTYDFFTPLKHGKEWLYELTRKHQPRTGHLLTSGGPLYLVGSKHEHYNGHPGEVYWQLVQDYGPFIIQIYRAKTGDNPEDTGYQSVDGRYHSLPEPIRLAYYTRSRGLDIPHKLFGGPIANYLLPLDLGGNWLPVKDYLNQLKLLKPHLDWLDDLFPGMKGAGVKKYDYLRYLICLDSRPTGRGFEGDVIFVNKYDNSGRMYLIHDGDVRNLLLLSDPGEAFDRYCEHVLLQHQGRFNFIPFTMPHDRG